MTPEALPAMRSACPVDWERAFVLDELAQTGPLPMAPPAPCEAPQDGLCATRLSALLRTIYAGAHRAGIGEFERLALGALREHVPFDAAWTGRASMSWGLPVPHNNYLHRLPRRFVADWLEVRGEDPMALSAAQLPGHACSVSTQQDDLSEGFRRFGAKYDIAHMINGTVDQPGRLATFLSLYRQADSPRFDQHEKRFVEAVVPHLQTAIELNHSYHLARTGEGVEQRVAICDYFGSLHDAGSSFLQAVRLEWPAWDDGLLPQVLVEHLRRHAGEPFLGERICIQVRALAGLFVLVCAARSRLDLLSPRERAVLCFFGDGLTHKHIAREMAIAPTTVCHHLRNAYKKLGISNKGQLASVLEPQRPALFAATLTASPGPAGEP